VERRLQPQKDKYKNQAPKTHTCNPSYSGGRGQEDHSSKLGQTDSLQDPALKKTHHKERAGGVAQGIVPEFKPQYHT
jgi:hypothetical protein